MHWTSYLAYRRVPANAQVIGDVHCVSCGYNLRGLRATGRCPECGGLVSDSLFVLVKPEIVAAALRSFSNSYFTLLVVALGCVSGMTGWPLLVTTGFIAGSAFHRAVHAAELRYRAQLGNSEKLASRSRLLWLTSLCELALASGWIAAAFVILYNPSPTATDARLLVATAWLLAALVNAAIAGWFGHALATVLGYGWMVIEFKIQLVAVAVCALVAVALYLLQLPPLTPSAQVVIGALAALVLGMGFVATWTVLHHAANAAEQEYGSWDEMLSSGQLAGPEDE